MKNMIARLGLPVVAVLMAGHLGAQTVNMTLETGNYTAESGFTASLNGGSLIVSDDLIGIYAFTINSINPNPDHIAIATPFYTTCLSPSGVLDWSTPDNYTLQTFAQADGGINPKAWVSPSGAPLAGIENANYIYTKYAGILELGHTLSGSFTGSASDQAAAMALAMYTALYNSTGYGSAADGTANSGFYLKTSSLSSAVANDYSLFLGVNGLKAYNGVPFANGFVLTPPSSEWNDGAGQAMILLGSGLPNNYQPVPEPTTMIAGALLLLPFGASTLRILRKNRAA